jgi:glycosyltransferase involved in cell wall biosynthesis
MRIGISALMIQRGRTGVSQYVLSLLTALEKQPGDHRIFVFRLEADTGLFQKKSGEINQVSVSEKFRPPLLNILWHQVWLPRLARKLTLDVLHVPSYRRLLWPRPCPLVGTIHDLAPFHLGTKYDRKRSFYGRGVVRRLAHRQDRIIAVSEATAADIVRSFEIPRERITVIHNGIDHQKFNPGAPDSARSKVAAVYGLERPFFLYVARLEHPGKNHVNLVSAFEMFKAATKSGWSLVFAGSDWHGAEAIHQAVERSPVAGDIRRLGFVPDEDLPDLYRAAGALVYPSLHEGFGLPPVEAMACGCPVVSSTRGALGEVVGQAAALVDPVDIHSIARQLYVISMNLEERNRFRAKGLARAADFDWNRTAAETLRVYERFGRTRASSSPEILGDLSAGGDSSLSPGP